MSVLVTPGNLRSSLAVTRSLGRRGISVTVAAEGLKSMAGSSRYCHSAICIPPAAGDGEAFVRAICQEVSREDHRVVIPTEDVSVSLLAEARPRFEGLAALPLPPIASIRRAHDKGGLTSEAQEKGIPVPKSVIVRDARDLSREIRWIGFPAVVRARVSWFKQGGQWNNAGGPLYVRSAEELEVAWQAIHQAVPFPLIQEYIPGEARGIFLLMNRGELRAAFAHRRIREKPPSGGVSVVSESVTMDPGLLECCRRLLEDLKWHGVAMLEFKRDARDGTMRLLEINGRFWGSLQLAVDAGIDFPYLLYRMTVDGDVEPAFSYQVGIRLRWRLGELDWLLLRLRENGRLAARLRAIRELIRPSGKMTRAEILRWDDPRPGLEEISHYVGYLSRSALRRVWQSVRHE